MDQLRQFIAEYELMDRVAFWGLHLLAALAIFLVGFWVAGRISQAVTRLIGRRLDKTLAAFLGNLLYALLLAVVIIAALDQLGFDTTSLLAILGAAGLAVGLALKDSLSNFASGVMLITFRPFKGGDFVQIGSTMGTVEEIRMFHTLLKTPGGQALWIPNGGITNSQITNFSVKPTRRVDIAVEVSYDDDLRKAREVIEQVVRSDERVLSDPAPQIVVVELAAHGVRFAVRPWTKTADWWPTTCSLLERIKLAFDEHGITIPYPQQDVHLYPQGEQQQ